MTPAEREAFNDTVAGVLSLKAGDAVPYFVLGYQPMNEGAAKAVRDLSRLGLAHQQLRVAGGLLVAVAVRTATPVVCNLEIAA